MIFPLRTDRQLTHRPWLNLTLIGVNVLIFILQLRGAYENQPWWESLLLNPQDMHWYQFFTYQFLHQGWEHLIFNMLFLYVFGNSLEDRLGPIGYLAFYLSGGVVAGMGHVMASSAPVLGASGAVSAVTGGFLALFPRSHVTVLLFMIVITFFEVPSMWLILLYIGQDLVYQALNFLFPGRFTSNVAYVAHLSGNAFGFLVGMVLLWTRVLPREPYDFLALLERRRRRRAMRATVRGGQSPWQHEAARTATASVEETDPTKRRIMELRARIADALAQHDAQQAMEFYDDLLRLDPAQVMPRQAQLDVANHAMNAGRYRTAARAYEAFLAQYPRDEYSDQVQLILGLIYARYLEYPDRAKPLLLSAADRLGDPARQQLALQILREIEERG